jgi:hypothetical protein
LVAALHTAHTPPGEPHEPSALSEPAHVGAAGFVLTSQHVPWQGWLDEHVAVHCPAMHALPTGQSLALVQPHTPPTPLSARPRHRDPAEPLHTAHAPPGTPHEPVELVADAQKPSGPPSVVSQHVPLQGALELHAEPQLCDVRSHAVPEGQSPGPLHPHVVPTQL